ncbi:MAG: sulfite exporter TauE/SafE family protein, partial [Sedimentisphaerales bacterium]
MSILLIACILAASLVSSLVGQGGGVLYTPVQVWFHTNVYQAATTSLFLIMVLSLSSSITFVRSGRIDWPLALVLESVTTISAFIGGMFSNRFREEVLLWILAGAITIAALPMVLSVERKHGRPDSHGGLMSW